MARMYLELPMWPDEEREEHGASRAILCTLVRHLSQAGFPIPEGVQAWEDYGWSFRVEREHCEVCCMIQASDGWILQCWPETGLVNRLRGRDHSHCLSEVMEAIRQVLAVERGIEVARWQSQAEFNAAPVP